MDQVLAICKVREKLKVLEEQLNNHPSKALTKEIFEDLGVFLDKGIDFKEVVDSLDDSIFITDKDGYVMYVNPAYEQNTGVHPDQVLHKYVSDLVANKVFTGGATLDVIKNKKKAFRLSTTYSSNPPRIGYAVGVPIFDNENELKQVVVSSRPILTLGALQEDYERFLSEIKNIHTSSTIRIVDGMEKIEPVRLIGSSVALKKVWAIIERVCDTDATVLITGESGVGKEIVADEIYKKSCRNDKPYIKVNCASIPANLLESELFGYEKGAFSGANTTGKQGLFEMANHGTLLLDEIGDMPMDLQVKLLRAIQNKEITRIGGTKVISLDIRFIALTNSILKEKIARGEFRSDLYYRLSVIPIHIPPLRERVSDISPLCTYFISQYSEKHKRYISLTENQIHLLELYSWPGNIRELENVIEYLTICSSGTGEVDEDMIKGLLDISTTIDSPILTYDLNDSVECHEKKLIEDVLKRTKNLREAGAILNVNASTVCRKIKLYNIDYPDFKRNR
jgi:transcriptional regulator with PAS, ATPase and Fis domain